MCNQIAIKHPKWVRSSRGILAGVFQGLGEAYSINPWLLRITFFLSFYYFGIGLLAYIVAAFVLPNEISARHQNEHKFLGVCLSLAKETGAEVGLVRFLAVLSGFTSFGMTLVVYVVLYFLLPYRQGLGGSYDKVGA